jgi:hypothetical protein
MHLQLELSVPRCKCVFTGQRLLRGAAGICERK